jgi:hypothetical protein
MSTINKTLSAILLATLAACATDAATDNDGIGEGGKGDLATGRKVLRGFEQPEAVVWDDQARVWYVSNFGGPAQLDGIDKDGDGFISRVSSDGTLVEMKWLTGLDAPKGMRLVGRTLYVVDVNQVLAVDVDAGEVTQRFPVEGSLFLNDVDVAGDGSLFVTDTLANTIVRIDPCGAVETFASGPQLINPNGIRVDGDRIVVAAWGPITNPMTFESSRPGDLYAISLTDRRQTLIASEVGNLDGLEKTGYGFLVTSWAGTVLAIDDDGRVSTLEAGFRSGADVAVGRGRIAVPELLEGTLTLIAE